MQPMEAISDNELFYNKFKTQDQLERELKLFIREDWKEWFFAIKTCLHNDLLKEEEKLKNDTESL